MNLDAIDNQGDDLGFSLGNDNLFELFAKGQNSDKPTAVDLAAADDEPAKDKTPDKTPAKTEDTDAKDKTPEVDQDALRQLIADDLKGTKGPDKPSDKTADTTGDKTKDTATDNPGGDDATDVSQLGVILSHYTEKGILDKLPEDFDGSDEEKLDASIEATVNNRLADAVDQSINEAFEKNPQNADVAKELIKHLGKGGSVADFVANNRDHGLKVEDLDAEDATVRSKTAERILTNYYRDVLNWPDDRIKRQLDRAKAKGDDIMIDEARDVHDEYKAHMDKKREDTRTTLTTAETNRQNQIKQYNQKLLEAIDTLPEIAGFQLKTKKDREALKDYMFKPAVELNGKKVPQYIADRHRLLNDPQTTLANALFMRNGLKPDTTQVTTKVVSGLEQKLSNFQKGIKASAASGQGIERKDRSAPGVFDFDNMEVINM